ncbi:MAG TPA: excinuclease ABC subunit A, partial [Pirellulaceae bacterium]
DYALQGRPGSRGGPRSVSANRFRSYTAEALAPMLEASVREDRATADISASPLPSEDGPGPLSNHAVKMPWEVNGPAWHCEQRVGRRGEACQWDGRILREVVKRIEELGDFAATKWDSRTIVEITGHQNPHDWFLHAITGEAWLLKLKFRVARQTFRAEELERELNLKTLNQMDDVPLYNNESRVRCKSLRGLSQEIEVRLHSWSETDTQEFWSFLERAVRGFERMHERRVNHPDEYTPWRKLGEKWHFSRKGFPPGKAPLWRQDLLEELCELLRKRVPEGQFLWNNQQIVHLCVKGQAEPWASVLTKKLADVELLLTGPKGRIPLGRFAGLGGERELDGTGAKRDVIRMKFRTRADLQRGDLVEFLGEHLQAVQEQSAVPTP